jgi:hypothetical protein
MIGTALWLLPINHSRSKRRVLCQSSRNGDADVQKKGEPRLPPENAAVFKVSVNDLAGDWESFKICI